MTKEKEYPPDIEFFNAADAQTGCWRYTDLCGLSTEYPGRGADKEAAYQDLLKKEKEKHA